MKKTITFEQLKTLVMEAKSPIDAEWKKYQANLKKILSYVPRLKKLNRNSNDKTLSSLKKSLSEDEFYDLFNTDRDEDKTGMWCLSPWYLSEYEIETWGAEGEGSYWDVSCSHKGADVIMNHSGDIYVVIPELRLAGNSPDMGKDITKDEIIRVGLDSIIDKDEGMVTYRNVFDAVQKLADGIGPYLDKVEKILEENGLKKPRASAGSIGKETGFNVQKNGTLLKYKGPGGAVVIPNGVTRIGHEWHGRAFGGRNDITSITIPDSVTAISISAFDNCTGLTSIKIPDSVKTMDPGVFEGCTNLKSVTLPNGLAFIDEYMFSGCSSLETVVIPNGVTRIRPNAFENCTGLTSITIPDSVEQIDMNAFDGCSNLSNVKLPSGLFEQAIRNPDKWFKGTPWAEKVKNGGISFEVNDSGTLDKYTGRETVVTIPNDVKVIGAGAFFGNGTVTKVTIPDSVTTIEPGAFENCVGLETIVLGVGIQKIEKDTFKNVSKNITIYVPNFDMCKLLLDSGLPDSATVIIGKGSSRRRLSWDPEK